MPTRLSFVDKFIIKEEIGKGAFAVVYRCVNIHNNKEFAVKVFKKAKLTNRDLYKIEKEVLICAKLHHPHIVRLHEVMSDTSFHYLVFDLITGGELFDDLVQREGSYTEGVTARCMFQLLDTIAYCHSVGVVHRDLKPENILLESRENKTIKVTDFGLAVEVEKDEFKRFGVAGTMQYIAPEVLEMQPYGKPVDCWACGVIMYTLLTGFMPFYHDDQRRLNSLITNGDYDLNHKTWDTVTPEGKDLVQKLLCVVPNRRITAEQALKHSWFVKMKSNKENILIRSETIERLKQLNSRRKVRDDVHTTNFISSFLTWKKKERINKVESTLSVVPSTQESRDRSRIEHK